MLPSYPVMPMPDEPALPSHRSTIAFRAAFPILQCDDAFDPVLNASLP
jgi:hypothetical protein